MVAEPLCKLGRGSQRCRAKRVADNPVRLVRFVKVNFRSVGSGRVAGQISCNMAGEAAILELKTGTYFGLDGVGAAVWNLIARPRRASKLRHCERNTMSKSSDAAASLSSCSAS